MQCHKSRHSLYIVDVTIAVNAEAMETEELPSRSRLGAGKIDLSYCELIHGVHRCAGLVRQREGDQDAIDIDTRRRHTEAPHQQGAGPDTVHTGDPGGQYLKSE